MRTKNDIELLSEHRWVKNIHLVAYDRALARASDNFPQLAMTRVTQAIAAASLETIGHAQAYGNSLALNLIKAQLSNRTRFDERLQKIQASQKELATIKYDLRAADRTILKHEAQIADLRVLSGGYIAIRLRFYDAYRRDVLKDPTARKTENIEKGNARAHHGDAITDAKLFDDGLGFDNGPLLEIY